MRDVADRAQESIDTMTDATLQTIRHNIRRNAELGLKPMGVCFYCESEVKKPQLFCNSDCASDYEHEQEQKRRLGRRR